MATVRSPSYPIIGLREALEKARMAWEKDYQTDLPRSVIAQHMGYSGINGKSLGLLATLTKFGLLEGRGDNTRITDLAVQVFAHEVGHANRRYAIKVASIAPPLFQEIDAKFSSRSPSDQALKSFLITRGFTHGGVDSVIRSFRETEAFVQTEVGVYTDGEAAEAPEVTMQATMAQPIATIPSFQHGVPTISMSDHGLEISGGVITTLEQFEKLIRRLKAGKILLVDDDDPEVTKLI